MTPIETQIVEAWKIHHRITMLLVGQLPEEALGDSLSKRGGRDVARQLAHVNNVRVQWIETFAKKNAIQLVAFPSDESPKKNALLEAFRVSGEAVIQFIEHAIANGGEVKGFKRGIVPFIGYLISHEAHHRGHLLLTIKQSGHKIPETLKWDIWDWSKA